MSLLVKGEVSPPIASKPFAEVKASCTILGFAEFLRVSIRQELMRQTQFIPISLGGTFNPVPPLEQFTTPNYGLAEANAIAAIDQAMVYAWLTPRDSNRSRCCGSMLAACQGFHACYGYSSWFEASENHIKPQDEHEI